MFIDTHAHLNFKAFNNDRCQIAKKCLNNNIRLINVGSNFATSKKAKDLAQRFEKGIYASVGLHPIHIKLNQNAKIKNDATRCPAGQQNENLKCKKELKEHFHYNSYKKLARSGKVVAIGETGLDYWQLPRTEQEQRQLKQKQKEVLLKHIKLAHELNLPLIFHCRKAHAELIEVLKRVILRALPEESRISCTKNGILACRPPAARLPDGQGEAGQAGFDSATPACRRGRAPLRMTPEGVIHCFTGNATQLQQYLDMGLYIGFNGIIFKLDLDNVIKKTPLDKIIIETDCPFLTPPKFPEKRNNPLAAKYIAKKISQIKKQSLREIARQTTKNAQELFGIPNT